MVTSVGSSEGTALTASRDDAWRRTVAIGLVLGDMTPVGIARYAETSLAAVAVAIERAEAAGLLVDGEVPPREAALLVAELGPDRVAEIHERLIRRLLVDGWDHLDSIVRHTAAAAAALGPVPELIALLDNAAGVALSTGDYAPARVLLALADEHAGLAAGDGRGLRLLRLARALDGLGEVEASRDAASRSFELAVMAGEADLAVEAAVMSAFPVDWYAGDLRTTALLQRAEAITTDEDGRVSILAARAIAELRIPVRVLDEQQIAWITRASVAQPLAEEALECSVGRSAATRLTALLAWRTSHRAPQHLERRRQVTLEAVDLAQQLRLPSRQVEAATLLAVDAIESGDRALFDEALAVARWVAERDGNPRLIAHTSAMQAGEAFSDGDTERARHHHRDAVDRARAAGLSSAFSIDQLLTAESFIVSDVPPPRELMPVGDAPILAHPLAQVATAIGWARLGEHGRAFELVERALRAAEDESSLLLVLTLAAEALVPAGASPELTRIEALLTPWQDHVAIDSNAWWHGEPVALTLATIRLAVGDTEAAAGFATMTEALIGRTGQVRSRRRLELLIARLGPDLAAPDGTGRLTPRQERVLELLAAGATNRQIARELSYSVSTVKADVSVVLRALGVANRTQAANVRGGLEPARSGTSGTSAAP